MILIDNEIGSIFKKFKNNVETNFVFVYHFLNLRLVLKMLNNNTLL